MTAGMITVPTIIPLKEPGSILAGSRKWMIDTETLIEIHTSSKDCLLFYTVDGTKPDPFKRTGNKTTHQFLKPFTLRAGKRTVKAVAVLNDGSKESSVNTKVFQVDEHEVRSDDNDDSIANKTNTSWATQEDNDNDTYEDEEKNFIGTLLEDSVGFNKSSKKGKGALITKVLTDSPRPPTQAPSRNSNDDDLFRCFHCDTERPRDPLARFCNGCGKGLPPAPGGIRSSQYFTGSVHCDKCGYEKATEYSSCKVCDSINKFQKPSKQRINCTNCNSMNPVTVENCLVCDEDLDNELLRNNMISKSIIHKPLSMNHDFIQCPFCERANSKDARYCDWCGKKPLPDTLTYTCVECRAENNLYAEYCCSCGNVLKAPVRTSFEDSMRSGNYTIEDSDNVNNKADIESNEVPWKKIKLKTTTAGKRTSKTVSTQAGEHQNTSPMKSKHNPSFNASPGKGYWRQQVEHICHHLKIYAQNTLEFRELIGDAVMSKMLSGTVEESEESNLKVALTFALRDGQKKLVTTPRATTSLELINALTSSAEKNKKRRSPHATSRSLLGSRPSSARSNPGSARSRPSSARSTTSSKGGVKKKKKTVQKSFERIEKEKVAEKLSKLTSENLKILNLIKSSKIIDEEKMEELMNSEKFDANTVDENDTPLLKLCVLNKHFSIIPLMISSGADVDKISGSKETSALHEAVLLGMNGRDAVSALLENGASADVKDKKGQTAFDIALESGIESLIEKFTKLTSKEMLDDVRL